MKITRFALSMVLVLALAGCRENASPTPAVSQPAMPQRPAFQLAQSAKRKLVEHAIMLKRGDSYQSVTNALGKPTFDQSMDLKDGRNIGRELKYYAVIWETGLVNELRDERIDVFLDVSGLVSSVDIRATIE